MSKKLLWNTAEVYNWASTHLLDNVSENAELLKSHKCSSQSLLDPSVVEDLMALGVSKFAAKDIHEAMKQQVQEFNVQSKGPAAVFWDYENVCIPKDMNARTVVNMLRNKIEKYGILRINIIGDLSSKTETEKQDLQFSGCHTIHTPHMRKPEVADKAIIAEILFFTLDHPPPASIIVISGDADFASVLSRLRDRGYRTVLIYPKATNEKERKGELLLNAASERLSWELDILAKTDEPQESPKDILETIPIQFEQLMTGIPRVDSSDIFFELLSTIRNSQKDGTARKSLVGQKIAQHNSDIYKRDAFISRNISNFQEYVKAAVDEGIVQEGGTMGWRWLKVTEPPQLPFERKEISWMGGF
ncbi:NYN domain-containing protein [Gorgonomyces haynaldii]|nr:NYN domain-containing protein [Gorgonomyces haynaldii]